MPLLLLTVLTVLVVAAHATVGAARDLRRLNAPTPASPRWKLARPCFYHRSELPTPSPALPPSPDPLPLGSSFDTTNSLNVHSM